MKQTIKGVIIGVVVAAGVSVLLAQSATWTTPRNWATDDLLTASDFNAQFRDNLLWLRQDAQLSGTDALGSRLRHARDQRGAVLGLHLGDDPGDACGDASTMARMRRNPSEMDPESRPWAGDCEWAELPVRRWWRYMGDTTTTAMTYQTVGPFERFTGQTVSGQTIACLSEWGPLLSGLSCILHAST